MFTMFASQSLSIHILRGVVGFGSFILAYVLGNPLAMIGLFVLGFVSLRGCPTCWTLGLIETIHNTRQRQRGLPEVVLCKECGEG
jgi:hypothetical protein